MKTQYNKNKLSSLPALPYGYVPPQAEDIEQAVLGAILLERGCFDIVAPIIKTEEVFYIERHRTVFAAIVAMNAAGRAVDLLTVTDYLTQKDGTEWAYMLTKLTMAVVSTAHVEHHAMLLVEKWMARQTIAMCNESIGVLLRQEDDVFEHIDGLMGKMMDLGASVAGTELKAVERDVFVAIKDIMDGRDMELEITGVPSGYVEIDARTGGWQKQNVIVLAARPSVGKTSFALNLAMNAVKDGYVVAVFSMEMSTKEILLRLLSAESTVPAWKIQKPKNLTEQDVVLLNAASEKIAKWKLYVDDTPAITPMQMRAKARKLKNKHGLDMIILDYIQLMECSDKTNNREQEVAKVSRDIKKTAKELDVPIIELSQLNRGVEKSNKGPQLSDLRESGAIEQDADIVMFLQPASPELIAQKPEAVNWVDILFSKGRSTGVGTAALEFDRATQKWNNIQQANQFAQLEANHSNRTMQQIGYQNINKEQLPF